MEHFQEFLNRESRRQLRRLGISKFLNYTTTKKVGSESFLIPLIGNESEDLLYVDRGFKSAVLEKLSPLFDTSTLVDVGANVGQTMLEAQSFRRGARYFGFEPNTAAFAILQKVARLNAIPATLFPWACSSSAEPVLIFTTALTDTSGTIVPEIRPDTYESVAGHWIAAYPFDRVASSMSLPTNFVMKIDVEGAELEVLRGATSTIGERRPAILCEVLHAHRTSEIEHNNRHKAAIEEFLRFHRYTLYACELQHDNLEVLLGIKKIDGFERNVLWKDAPNACDYVLLPRELSLES